MKQYHDYLKFILENGIKKEDRTGTGTISIFGYQMRFNLNDGFPLITTKKLHFKSIVHELLWFLSGDTNIKYLNDNGVKIWDSWAIKETKLHGVGWIERTPMYEYIKDNTNTSDSIEDIENYIKNHSFKEIEKYYNLNLEIDYDEREYIIQEVGEVGPMYGKQWTNWEYKKGDGSYPQTISINQISNVIKQIKNNPDSRRLIVSAWNVADLPDEILSPQENVKQGKMALAPCHVMFQFYTTELSLEERYSFYHNSLSTKEERFKNMNENKYYSHNELDNLNIPKRKLSCMLTQRSCDSFLGVPYNIASYSLLTHMIAQQCNLEVGEFIWSGGDCHIYTNHIEQVKDQLSRKPYELPKLKINRKPESIFNYKYEDFEIIDYKAHPHIKGVVAI